MVFKVALVCLFVVVSTTYGALVDVKESDTIQRAINRANNGDTVVIHGGTYSEDIEINKSTYLLAINNSVICPVYNGLVISADKVVLDGLTISNSRGYGVVVNGNNSILKNNIINDNENGLVIYNSNGNRIINNTIRDNGDIKKSTLGSGYTITYGILLRNSYNITIDGNRLLNNLNGISINPSSLEDISKYNKIINNIINDNSNGIDLNVCSYNIISNNKIKNNEGGISIFASNDNFIGFNEIMQNGASITFAHHSNNPSRSRNNSLESNIIENNERGIKLYGCDNSKIKNNTINRNVQVGIELIDSSFNSIEDNRIYDNLEFGIEIHSYSKGNVLNNNYLKNNGLSFGPPSDPSGFGDACDVTRSNWWDGSIRPMCTWACGYPGDPPCDWDNIFSNINQEGLIET